VGLHSGHRHGRTLPPGWLPCPKRADDARATPGLIPGRKGAGGGAAHDGPLTPGFIHSLHHNAPRAE